MYTIQQKIENTSEYIERLEHALSRAKSSDFDHSELIEYLKRELEVSKELLFSVN